MRLPPDLRASILTLPVRLTLADPAALDRVLAPVLSAATGP